MTASYYNQHGYEFKTGQFVTTTFSDWIGKIVDFEESDLGIRAIVKDIICTSSIDIDSLWVVPENEAILKLLTI
jgi:hypothetical protein